MSLSSQTIIQQGRFTSTGSAQTIAIRSGVDWIRIYNYTVAAANQTTAVGVEYYWQQGMPNGGGIEYKKSNAANAANLEATMTAPNGITIIDSSANTPGAAVAITATSNAVRPIVSTGNTAGLATGSVVRLSGVTGANDLDGVDFAIDTIVTNTSFRIAGALATAPGAAGTAGFYRRILYDPLYYPTWRFIVNVTQAASAVVTLSVPSLYKVGDQVRFHIPSSIYGMTQLDGVLATVTAVTDTVATQSITVNVDTTGFTAFAFPTAAQAAANVLSPAIVVPVGMDTAYANSVNANPLADATYNSGYIGVSLAAGADAPAGQTNDVIYWVAGKSFAVSNT